MNLQISINILSFYIILFLATFSSGAKTKNNATDTDDTKSKRIDIKNKNSNRQRTTTETVTTTTTTTTASAIPADSEVVLYRLEGNNNDGVACILIRTDALIEFKYKNKNGYKELEESDLYVPSKYDAVGKCNDDDSYIEINWKGYTWSIYFKKTPGGEHWYVSDMSLELDSYGIDKSFKHLAPQPKKLLFSVPKEKAMLFPTPVGKAYTCGDEISVEMTNPVAEALVLFRNTKMQPFIFKKDDFGPEYVCTPGGVKSFRDETAPIAVGSTFAIVTLLTVTGYGVYRYMKIKKVQYDTME